MRGNRGLCGLADGQPRTVFAARFPQKMKPYFAVVTNINVVIRYVLYVSALCICRRGNKTLIIPSEVHRFFVVFLLCPFIGSGTTIYVHNGGDSIILATDSKQSSVGMNGFIGTACKINQ